VKDCLFCRIIRGEIPSQKVYEDDEILAFHDVNPARPVHFLIVPKEHIASLADVNMSHQDVLGRMLVKANELALGQGLSEGFRAVINTGRIGGQEVYHLHVHILGGPEPVGPMLTRLAS